MRSLKRLSRALVGLVLCALLLYGMVSLGIVGKADREIAGGYYLFSDGLSTTCLMTPTHLPTHPSQPRGGVAVAAKITSIGVVGEYIAGYVESSPRSVIGDIETPGYFIVNWTTGEVSASLGYEECIEMLRQHGYEMPRLRRARPLIGW